MSRRSGSAAWAVFFARDVVTCQVSLDGSEAKSETLPGKRMTHLFNGGVLGGNQCGQNSIMVRFDTAGAMITARAQE